MTTVVVGQEEVVAGRVPPAGRERRSVNTNKSDLRDMHGKLQTRRNTGSASLSTYLPCKVRDTNEIWLWWVLGRWPAGHELDEPG